MKRCVKAGAAGSTVELEGVGGSVVSIANHRAKVASAIINEADVLSCTRHTGRKRSWWLGHEHDVGAIFRDEAVANEASERVEGVRPAIENLEMNGKSLDGDGVADHGLNDQTSGGGAVGAIVHAVALGCDVGTATAVRALELDVGYEMVLAFLSSRHCRCQCRCPWCNDRLDGRTCPRRP